MGDGGQSALLKFIKDNCPLDFPMGAILHLESNGKDACTFFLSKEKFHLFLGKRDDD